MSGTKVEIDGMQFQVVGNEDSEYVRRIALDLTKRIEAIRNANYRLNEIQSILLAGLNLVDEKQTLEKRLEELGNANPDSGLSKEYLEEMDRLKDEVQKTREENRVLKDTHQQQQTSITDLESKLKENSKKLNVILEENQKWKEQGQKWAEEKKKLEDGSLEAQKRIVDLNKEISMLSQNGELS